MQRRHAMTGHEKGGVVRRAINATIAEVGHLYGVADKGESDATPAILVGAVLTFVVPFVALAILLVVGVAALS